MSTPVYYVGDPSNMGRVSRLSASTFAELVEQVITQPQPVPFTSAELLAMPKAQQAEAKKSAYIVPCAFTQAQSQRLTAHATEAHLLCLDVDDAAEAGRIINTGLETLVGDLNVAVWHTARSTPAAPRLRIVVPTAPIPVQAYPVAVTALAGMLGMSSISHESKVVVQPMYLPLGFKDAAGSPLAYVKTDGHDFDPSTLPDLPGLKPAPAGAAAPDASDADMGDIEYLRAPLDDIHEPEIAEALEKIDPSCAHQQWVEIGMALKHQFGETGFPIWEKWSATSSDKYPGTEALRAKWASFTGQPKDRVPVTIRTLIKVAVDSGWNNRPMTARLFDGAREWIRNPARSSEELLDQGAKRIAKLSPVIGPIETKVLVSDLHSVTRARGLRGPTQADIAKEIKRLGDAAARAAATQPPWASGIVFLTAPNLFFRFADNRKLRREVVDLIYRSPDPMATPCDYLIHQANVPVVENVRYNPAQKKRIFTENGVPFINTYRPCYPKPDPFMAAEAGEHWLEHMRNLCGRVSDIVVTNFIAHTVQFPGVKMRWCPFIFSPPGAGKGLTAYGCEQIHGQPNVQRLMSQHAMEGVHNSWATGYVLTIMDEIHEAGENSHRAMDKLKPVISDDFISVRPLYEPVQTVPNITNYLLFSNHYAALAITADERRYHAINSPLNTRAKIEALGSEYHTIKYDVFTRLAAGLRSFFESWRITDDFRPQGRAPVTPYMLEMARMTASPLSRAVIEAIEDQPHPLVRKDLVSLTALRGVLPVQNLRHFSDQALTAILREQGFQPIGRHRVDGGRHTLFAIDPSVDNAQRAQDRMDLL